MKYFFSATGTRILESLTFTRTLYAFDFDGTLAPIVESPADARMSRQTSDMLNSLSQKVPVAIISGRSVADLRMRLGFDLDILVGNHGLEGLDSKVESIDQAKNLVLLWKKQLGRLMAASKVGADPGVFIEDKAFSLALHYRKSRNKKEAKFALLEVVGSLQPSPRLILGKAVINLLPPGAPHKGIALMELMIRHNAKCAFYIGDDDTDEDVFSLPDSKIITVRVGQRRNSQAQFYLKRQNELNRLLRNLLRMVECGSPK